MKMFLLHKKQMIFTARNTVNVDSHQIYRKDMTFPRNPLEYVFKNVFCCCKFQENSVAIE